VFFNTRNRLGNDPERKAWALGRILTQGHIATCFGGRHSSANLTLRTYSHVVPREDDSLDFLPSSVARGKNAKAMP
jgi:hypothetical protein